MSGQNANVLLEFYLDGYGIIDFYEDTTFMVDCRRNGEAKRFPIDMPFVDAIHKQIEEEGIWLLHVNAVYFDENGNVQKEIRITDGFRNDVYETLEQVKNGTYESEWIPPEERKDESEIWDITRPGRIFENGKLSEYQEMPWKAKGTKYSEGDSYIVSGDEHEANDYIEAFKMGEFSRTIQIYSSIDAEYEYLVEIYYGDGREAEFIYCKTMRDFLDLLKELKPVIDGLQHEDVLTHLEALREELHEELQDIVNAKNLSDYTYALQCFDYLQESVDSALKIIKRKNFILSDISKEVIKSKKAHNRAK